MIKCIKSMIFVPVLVLLLGFGVSAKSNTYTIHEMGLDIAIPDSYTVITRDTPANASVFSDLGVTKSDLIEQFEANKIYLNAIVDSLDEEVVVTMDSNIIDNFSVLSDTSLKTLASSWVNEYEKMGINILKYDIYQHSQAKFVRFYFEVTANSVNGLQYYTIYNGKAMNFTMRSYSGKITQKQEETIKSIVDSIKYDTDPVSAPAVPETDSFVYTDVDTNTKFTVPANWYEKELSKEREFIDVKFMSAKEEGMTIIYGSTDAWEMMTEVERDGATRSDINNSAFTLEDMTEFFGVDKSEISRVRYNGVEYFQATVKTSTELYGLDFTAEMTHLVRFDNGWVYWFQFGGTTSNEYFSDFETLLNSVEYPYNEKTISTTDNKPTLIFLGIIVLVAIFISIFVEIRMKKGDKACLTPVSVKNTCPYCNATLSDDGEFCHKCGNKLSTGEDRNNDL